MLLLLNENLISPYVIIVLQLCHVCTQYDQLSHLVIFKWKNMCFNVFNDASYGI